jgi:hypothetical protein
MQATQPQCNAEILAAVCTDGMVSLPNQKADNFKRWMSSPILKFEYIVKGELTTIKKVK